MKKEQLYEVVGDIDESYVAEARTAVKKKRSFAWLEWVPVAACLCLFIVGFLFWKSMDLQVGGNILMGDSDIYPMVMVDGQLYEWHGCDELPADCVYYGEIKHVEGKTPANDGEFVSWFSVSGQIYTVSGNSDCVYLCVTTEWLTEATVLFDIVR